MLLSFCIYNQYDTILRTVVIPPMSTPPFHLISRIWNVRMVSKSTLCVIGNGFDLHHWGERKPNTSFESFRDFLAKNKSDIYDLFCKFFPLVGDWGNFEVALSEFDTESLWDDLLLNFLDDSDPHRAGEASWEAQKYVDLLTTGMRKELQTFIHGDAYELGGIQFPQNIDDTRIQIPQDALYLSFNYTNTLERYYDIAASAICYIHGKSGNGNDLVIGHGVAPIELEKSEQTPVMPKNLNPQQQEEWEDCMNNQYSLSGELAKDEIEQYWSQSYKNSKSIIEEQENFFKSYEGLDCVIVMGHSISDVDFCYFEEIKERVHKNTVWKVSFYDENEKARLKSSLSCLGVLESRVEFFQLKDFI